MTTNCTDCGAASETAQCATCKADEGVYGPNRGPIDEPRRMTHDELAAELLARLPSLREAYDESEIVRALQGGVPARTRTEMAAAKVPS